MYDLHTKEELTFDCNRWLSREEDDGEICREMPAVRKGERVLPSECIDILLVTGTRLSG